MGLIVLPLCGTLLWLGWRSVDFLEENSADQRMGALHDAVAGFVATGVRVVIAGGEALADGPVFRADTGAGADDERRRELMGLLERHPDPVGRLCRLSRRPPALCRPLLVPVAREGPRVRRAERGVAAGPHDRRRGRGAASDLVVRPLGRLRRRGADDAERLRSPDAALVCRRREARRVDPDRPLWLRLDDRYRRVGRRAGQRGAVSSASISRSARWQTCWAPTRSRRIRSSP